MKCAKCGKKLRNNEKFCTYCGYYNDTKETETWNEEATEEENLLDENWYDEEIDSNEDEEVIIEPVKKEKAKKEKKIKEEKPPKKEKKEKEINKIEIKEDTEVYDQNERYIEAYIGEDYRLIKKSVFNIWAFLLNWMYLLYRKLYITGIIGLILTTIVALFLTKYFIIYLIIMLLVLGFGFNPYYIFIVKRKVNKILEQYEGTDSFSLEKMCSEFGGVNVIMALIIYLVFLVAIVLSIVKPTINKTHNTKFWKENSENKANCTSLIKLVYNEEKNNYNKIQEAVCRINKNSNVYELYLKAKKEEKIIYIYYETDKDYVVYKNNTELMEKLNEKKKTQSISEEEEKYLKEATMIISNYEKNHDESIEEDKLINAKKDKEEKTNFIFEREELVR